MLHADIDLRQGAFHLDVALRAPHGVTAIFGPSGSGKSTLLAALAGLRPGGGTISLDGQKLDPRPHRRGIGLVFQDGLLFPHMSVGANLLYAWRRADPSRRHAIEDVAGFFDIATLLDRSVVNLSGGERARVALARALVAAPRLLLLDEPFSALDGQRRRSFIDILGRMHDAFGLSMLIVTHLIDDAAALATHLVGLRDGRVVAEGAFAQTVSSPAFRTLLDARDTGAALSTTALVRRGGGGPAATWVRADHVLLATRKPTAISARNILRGSIGGITTEESESLLVELHTADGVLFARLTQEAVDALKLRVGMPVWALVKAHAL
ncbi:MAG TPA: ATP-binding cassette domain-containing protein [Sphingomonas sp.]|uniref:molybdenum ABC transporter ATP-binding protein n=1 Tax=Sphingomonas sp. TaxID=28214 RepID=UPI002CF7161C|nr:ATP-binding cassette domain-containing protein [Sphingomonas sp.]HMI20595.1 ATP-binding cassette domain-containing protein [Sphingomonas sp.]